MKSKLLAALLGIGLLVVAGAAPAQAAVTPHSTTYTMCVTLYGALDNDPPGSADIAYPQRLGDRRPGVQPDGRHEADLQHRHAQVLLAVTAR